MAVCSCLTEKPYIQVQGKSEVCAQIAKDLHSKLQDLYSKSIQADPKSSSSEPQGIHSSADIENSAVHNDPDRLAFNVQRATLLILDRSIDYASAFCHDYSYGHMLYELHQPEQQIEEAIEKFALKIGKNESLTRNDELWQTYKTYTCG